MSAHEPVTHGALAEASSLGRRARSLLAAWSYRLPVECVYVSLWLAETVGEPQGRRVRLGIDHSVFRPPSSDRAEDRIRVGIIARRGAVKGFGDFLAAWQGFTASAPVELVVVAADPVEVPRRLPVQVLGPRTESQMADFYRRCHVFVFPSLSEGFPAPPLEAMACGAAVVATRCGGIEEYAVDELNCLLVPVSDPPALRAAIRRVVEDRGLRERLAGRAQASAAEYTRERMIQDLRALIEPPAHPMRTNGRR